MSLLGLWVGICAAEPAAVSDAVIPFQLVNQFLVVVQVHIGTSGPYRFVVDTGANVSIIDSQLARELKLRGSDRTAMQTPAGTTKVELAELPLVKTGFVGVRGLQVAVQAMREMHEIDPQIRGVLGANFLSRFDYQFDYRYRQILVDLDHSRTEMLEGARLPLRHDCGDDSDVLEITVQSHGNTLPAKLRLKLDSGTRIGAVFSREAKARAEMLGGVSYRAINDSGSSEAKLVSVQVTVGQKSFSSVNFLLMDERRDRTCFDGLLPESLLKNVYVSHSGGFAIVQPFEY